MKLKHSDKKFLKLFENCWMIELVYLFRTWQRMWEKNQMSRGYCIFNISDSEIKQYFPIFLWYAPAMPTINNLGLRKLCRSSSYSICHVDILGSHFFHYKKICKKWKYELLFRQIWNKSAWCLQTSHLHWGSTLFEL